jgi:hypothetical protein
MKNELNVTQERVCKQTKDGEVCIVTNPYRIPVDVLRKHSMSIFNTRRYLKK